MKMVTLRYLFPALSCLILLPHAGALDYLEQFDQVGEPSTANGYWYFDNGESGLQPTWEDFCPGDGYAHFIVDAEKAKNNDRKYQAIGFGEVGPGHRLEIRAKNLVIPGLTGFIFTYAYAWENGAGYFDEIDIEVVSDDGSPNHGIDPPDGWSDARFNSWGNAGENSFSPYSGAAKAVVDESAQNISLLDDRFHTYTIDWYPDRLQFFIDGIFQHEITNVVPQRDYAEAILGYRDLSWAGNVNWTGQKTGLIDYFRVHPIVWGNEPEIVVEGNANDITDGNITPSAADGTDFGSVDLEGGSATKTYTIRNTGNDTLSIYDVMIQDDSTNAYTITLKPDLIVDPGASTTLSVTFDPTTEGIAPAVVKIINDDRDEAPFTFAIRGFTLTDPAPPTAVDDAYLMQWNKALQIAAPGVLANDFDVNGDAISAVLVAGPDHGQLSLQANGSFTYTPDSGYSGNDSFTYQASDGSDTSDSATVSITVRKIDLQADLYAYYPLDTDTLDYSGNLRDGTPVNSPSFVPSQVGGGIRFDAQNEHVALPGADLTVPWTASYWVKREGNTDWSVLARSSDPSANNHPYLFLEHWDGSRTVGVGVSGDFDSGSSFSTSLNSWVHLLFVGQSSGVTLYVDGSPVGTMTSISYPAGSIGDSTGSSPLTVVDDVAVWTRALEAFEIQELFNRGNTGEPLVWSDRDNDGLSTHDEYASGTNPNDATSVFSLTDLSIQPNGTVHLEWSSVPNRNYTILHSSDLIDWTAVQTDIAPTAPTNQLELPISPDEPNAFYRVKTQTP